jgi:predicted nucleotidyltransferase
MIAIVFLFITSYYFDMEDYLRNAILATLVYYDILNMPLTLIEIYKFLINPGRISNDRQPIGDIKLSDIQRALEKMISANEVNHKNGFYFLPGQSDLYNKRIDSEKILAQKWKKMLRRAKYFVAVPYLRGVFASGSMAIGNVNSESDWDALIIVKPGRLYTARIFLSLVASLLRARRKRYDKIAADKFCFNHYLTADSLNIKHESLFNAQTYVSLKPIMVKENIFDEFYSKNIWLNKYVYSFKPSYNFVRTKIGINKFLLFLAKSFEFLLDNLIGNHIENILRRYQHWRIKNNPATYGPKGRVVFGDRELEFHPRSFEAKVIKEFNSRLINLGIYVPNQEVDSGLLN